MPRPHSWGSRSEHSSPKPARMADGHHGRLRRKSCGHGSSVGANAAVFMARPCLKELPPGIRHEGDFIIGHGCGETFDLLAVPAFFPFVHRCPAVRPGMRLRVHVVEGWARGHGTRASCGPRSGARKRAYPVARYPDARSGPARRATHREYSRIPAYVRPRPGASMRCSAPTSACPGMVRIALIRCR